MDVESANIGARIHLVFPGVICKLVLNLSDVEVADLFTKLSKILGLIGDDSLFIEPVVVHFIV